MRAADAEVLAHLATDAGLNVVDGEVRTDDGGRVSEQVPYLVYRSSVGAPGARRGTSTSAARVMTIHLTGVGFDREQAKAHLERAERLLDGHRLPAGGLVLRTDNSDVVRVDDDAMTTDNQRLHYGRDEYRVRVPRT